MATRILAFLSALVFIATLGVSALGDGVDAGSFVRDGVGARAFGMGGAFVSIADGVSTAVWNPAGLATLSGISLGGMYSDKYGLGIYFQSLGVAARFSNLGAGLTMVRSSIEDVPFYGDEGDGFFSETQTLITGSVGYDLNELVSIQTGPVSALLVGANIKYYTHTLLEGLGSALGFDVSALLKLSFDWGGISVGASSFDVGTTAMRWSGTDHNPVNDIPWINKVGASIALFDEALRIAADADIAVGRPNLDRLHTGIEYWPIQELGMRGGLIIGLDGSQQLSAGASVRLKGIAVDYAYVPHSILGASHILSAQFYLPDWGQASENTDDQ